ncbi:MAG: lipid-binding SYLF domain-containing protein [Acidobacteria bacterium]|nr:lipid-binding SYLF domain-containing protein [Acidobacteriota bacterium]
MKRNAARARHLAVAVAALACLLGAPRLARAQVEQQELVDRATLTVQDLFTRIGHSDDPLRLIRRARGVMVCPQVFRAGFFFGGSGGQCVLVGRDPAGNWSYPAFYSMTSGSFGFQAGIQDAQILMLILTEHGMAAVMDDQFKLGGDASLTFATLGTGIQGATAAGLGADILVVNKSRGLFAGITLEGSILSTNTGANQAYYGVPMAARQIVAQGQARNPGAEPLRDILARYSSAAPVAAAAYAPQGAPATYPQPPYPAQAAPAYGQPPMQSAAPAPVTATPLPPPR